MDFDFQITTSKLILILNHLYLGDWIWILKSSTYDDFAHHWVASTVQSDTITTLDFTEGLLSVTLCTGFTRTSQHKQCAHELGKSKDIIAHTLYCYMLLIF